MVEQFWYTACPIGLDHSDGFQIRAASAYIQSDKNGIREKLKIHLIYILPKGETSYINASKAPISLTYTLIDNQAVLLNKQYIGFGYGNRPGTFFIHGILSLPANFGARGAIRLWAANNLWKRDDKSIGPNELILPSLPDSQIKFDTPPALDLRDPKMLDAVKFVLKAVLLRQKEQRIFIYAPSEQVAAIIYGVTQCLPNGILEKLTFSTYENDVLIDKQFVITGGCRSELSPVPDLPAQCYQQLGFAINMYEGTAKQSALSSPPQVEDFINLALNSLQFNNNKLTNYLAIANAMQARDWSGMLSAFVYYTKETPNWDEVTILTTLQNSSLATIQLAKSEFRKRLLVLVCEASQLGQSEWLTSIKDAIRSLYSRQTAGLDQLAEDAQDEANVETLNRDCHWKTIVNLLDGLATAASGASSNTQSQIWQDYFTELTSAINSNSKQYPLVFRLQVLGRVKNYVTKLDVDPWLRTLSNESLQTVFEDKALPAEWKSTILCYALMADPAPTNGFPLIELAINSQSQVEEAVWKAFDDSKNTHVRTRLFDRLHANKYDEGLNLLLQMVKRMSNKEQGAIRESDDLMQNILSQDPYAQKSVLLEPRWRDTLISTLHLRPNVLKWTEEWLNQLSVETCKEDQTISLLKAIVSKPNIDKLHPSARWWLTIAQFMQDERLSKDTLSKLNQQLQDLPNKDDIIYQLMPSIMSKISESAHIKWILESIGQEPRSNNPSSSKQIKADEPTNQDRIFIKLCKSVQDSYLRLPNTNRRSIVHLVVVYYLRNIPGSTPLHQNVFHPLQQMLWQAKSDDSGLIRWIEDQKISHFPQWQELKGQSSKSTWIGSTSLGLVIGIVISGFGCLACLLGILINPPTIINNWIMTWLQTSTPASVVVKTAVPAAATAVPATKIAAPAAATAVTAVPIVAPAIPNQLRAGTKIYAEQSSNSAYLDVLLVNSGYPNPSSSVKVTVIQDEPTADNKWRKITLVLWSTVTFTDKNNKIIYFIDQTLSQIKENTYAVLNTDDNANSYVGTFKITSVPIKIIRRKEELRVLNLWWEYEFTGYIPIPQ